MTLSDAIPLQAPPDDKPNLDEAWSQQPDPEVLGRIQRAKSLMNALERASVEELVRYLGDPHPFVRWEAGHALSRIADRLQQRSRLGRSLGTARQRDISFAEALDLLGDQLRAEDPTRRAAAAEVLGYWHHERAASLLLRTLDDPQPVVRSSVIASLGRIGNRAFVSPLIKRLSDPSVWVRRATAEALGALRDPQAVPALRRVALQDDELAASAAIAALGHLPGQRTRRALSACLELDNASLRWYAVRSLGEVGGIGAIPALRAQAESQDVLFGRSMAELSAWAIGQIERREIGLWNRLRKAILMTYTSLSRLVRSQGSKRHSRAEDTPNQDSAETEED